MKKAFSLIELMIVIVIMGVLYTLSVQSFSNKNNASKRITLLNLKEHMQGYKHEKSVKLLCLDDCKSCDIFIDGEKSGSIENLVDDSVHVYRYEFLNGTRDALKEVYFNEEDVQEDVCFSYNIDKQGVGDQILVEYKKSVYDFTTYLGPTKKYASLEYAMEAKEKLIREVE
jgi:prepilin-type N-terminal cleavage/methylation domain-containing protein